MSLILTLLIFGCANPPPPTTEEVVEEALPEETEIPEQWTTETPEVVDSGKVDDGWVKSFQDPQLEAIVAEALKKNLNLRAAAATVEIAAGYAIQAGAQLAPAVGIGLGGETTGRSTGRSESTGAALSISWELDVWGRVRAQAAAGEASYAASVADFEFARQSLAAQAAKAWFLATETRLQHELAKESVQIYQRLLELVQTKFDVGQVSQQELSLSQADLAATEERLRQTQGAHEQVLRSLEVLLGRYPSAEIETAAEFIPLPPPVPVGLPSELLERRPDLLAAEQRIIAAFELITEAKAARLPRLSLTAGLGTASTALTSLLGASNEYWSAGANFAGPIFTGGALEAQVDIRTAEQEAAFANYGQTALTALSEVETSLSNEQLLKEREAYQESVVQNNTEAWELALIQYDVGKIDLLSVLQMQARVLNAKIGLIRLKNSHLQQRVDLHLALGGSFEESGE